MQANSRRQDLVALLDARARSSYQLPTGSRHESVLQASSQDQVARLDAPSCQLTSGGALQGYGGPDYDHSQLLMEANSQDHVTQLNASSYGYQSPIGSAPKASASPYSTLANALSESSSVTPTQPQDQPDARPNELTPSNAMQCPICGVMFGRMQERDRHLESYLPHSIYCPSHGCSWTGRRQWDFKGHWKKNHSNSSRVPMKTNETYDPKKFVKSIVDGTPLVEVVQSVCSMVQERLEKLGKVDVGVNVWGRKKVDMGCVPSATYPPIPS